MSKFYDRQGKPLAGVLEWGRLLDDDKYRVVARTEFPYGIIVSTVWLGIDHNFGGVGSPLIFETMVLADGDPDRARDQMRYSREEEALRGHEEMVNKWKITSQQS